VGGTWGAIATGLFATKAVNSVVTNEGLLVSGDATLLGSQVLAILMTYGLAIVGTLICLGIAGVLTGGVRVDEDGEFAGLDLSQHSETAYAMGAAAQAYEPVSMAATPQH
jgi:ammonium transporter, Amt family